MSKEVGEMVRSRDVVQAEGSARTEGARRATGVPADGAAAGAGSLAPGQRWSASRKRDVVLRLLRGESLEALSREVGVEIYRLDAWRARAMVGLELGLQDRHGEPVAEVLDAAKRHIGELSMGHCQVDEKRAWQSLDGSASVTVQQAHVTSSHSRNERVLSAR